MRILYVRRDEEKTGLRRWLKRQRRQFVYGDQEGSFEASLAAVADVTEISFEKLKSDSTVAKEYDAVVVNMKCAPFSSGLARTENLRDIAKNVSVPTGIFIGSAQAEFMLPNEVLDAYDVIYKREPYRDRSRYEISEQNKAKIVPTMISCPFVCLQRPTLRSRMYCALQPKINCCVGREETSDVGFSGVVASSHPLRQDVWQRVVNEGFSTIGGLQPNPYKREPIPEALQGPRYKGRAYRDALCAAKINLALDGIGQYTFRHQELLYLGAFMMSGPSIRDLELPMPLKENEHYIAFDDLDDMVEKIRYYLAHDDERLRIAAAGKKLFDEYYNPERHGEYLVSALGNIVR